MAKLNAGSVPNLETDTLAGAMDTEFRSLWGIHKEDIKLPNDATAKLDRQLMFLAIARGILTYLEDHRADIELLAVFPTRRGLDRLLHRLDHDRRIDRLVTRDRVRHLKQFRSGQTLRFFAQHRHVIRHRRC